MPDREYRIEVIADENGLMALRGEWDSLFRRASARQLSQSHEWIWYAWEKIAKPNGDRPCVIVVRRPDRIALIWPVKITLHKYFWRAAGALGTPEDYPDILAEPSHDLDEIAASAWRTLLQVSRADLILFKHVRQYSLLHRVLTSGGGRIIASQPAPFVTPSGFSSWTSYWESLDKKFRSNIDRRQRRLSECGDVSFEVVTEDKKLQEIVSWLIKHKRDWLIRKKLTYSPSLTTPSYDDFLYCSMGKISKFGHFVGFAITLDGTAIAAQVGTLCDRVMSSLHIAYDVEYARFSPGHILHKYSLQWAFERGIDYDFRFGFDEHKRNLSNQACDAYTITALRTARGWIYEGLRLGSKLQLLRPLLQGSGPRFWPIRPRDGQKDYAR